MLPYTSQIAEEASFFDFFQLPYLEHNFMIY